MIFIDPRGDRFVVLAAQIGDRAVEGDDRRDQGLSPVGAADYPGDGAAVSVEDEAVWRRAADGERSPLAVDEDPEGDRGCAFVVRPAVGDIRTAGDAALLDDAVVARHEDRVERDRRGGEAGGQCRQPA